MTSARQVLVALGLALAGPALSQTSNYNPERLRLDPAATGSLVLGGGELLPEGTFRLGLGLHYEREPLGVADDLHLRGAGLISSHDIDADLLKNRLTAHITGAVALGKWPEPRPRVPRGGVPERPQRPRLRRGGGSVDWLPGRGQGQRDVLGCGLAVHLARGGPGPWTSAGMTAGLRSPASAARGASGKHAVLGERRVHPAAAGRGARNRGQRQRGSARPRVVDDWTARSATKPPHARPSSSPASVRAPSCSAASATRLARSTSSPSPGRASWTSRARRPSARCSASPTPAGSPLSLRSPLPR